MGKLSITDNQHLQIIDAVDTALHSAFLEGVSAPSDSNALPLLQAYDQLSASQQAVARATFESVLAALVKILEIDKPLPAVKYTGTVALAKLTGGGANGSLTVVDGIITAYTAPT